MSDKKAIENLVKQINEKYLFVDHDGIELRIHANPNLNGYELWLYRVNGGGVAAMLTQYQQISAKYALLILKMLLYEILESQFQYKHYSVQLRKKENKIIIGS